MKYIFISLAIFTIFSCKKENQTTIQTTGGIQNKIEGDIIWGGLTTTHFLNKNDSWGDSSAFFVLDTPYSTNNNHGISITGFENDTIISLSIENPDLNKPGVYNFQSLDSSHFIYVAMQSGYSPGNPPEVDYIGLSFSNKGQLTIDTISETYISGSVDAYCYRQNLVTNIPDTNEVHLLIHFSGDLRKG